MNKKNCTAVILFSLCLISTAFSQRALPIDKNRAEIASNDVVGTWKWFCGSVVTINNNGDVYAVWNDGKHAEAKYEKIGDNRYRFVWGNNEWIDVLKLKKEGNILEGINQCGSKVTATKISSTIDKANIQKAKSHEFSNTAEKTNKSIQNQETYVGEWKMSSWDGHYVLLRDGSCTIDNDPSHPARGVWFLAFDRLYLVWEGLTDTDVFKLNTDPSMILQRIDNRSASGVTFEKILAADNSRVEGRPRVIRRKIIPIPPKPST